MAMVCRMIEIAHGTKPACPTPTSSDNDGMTNAQNTWLEPIQRFEQFSEILAGHHRARHRRDGVLAKSTAPTASLEALAWRSGLTKPIDAVARPTNRLERVTDTVSRSARFYRLVTPAQPTTVPERVWNTRSFLFSSPSSPSISGRFSKRGRDEVQG